jgi:hypothetical protein
MLDKAFNYIYCAILEVLLSTLSFVTVFKTAHTAICKISTMVSKIQLVHFWVRR